MAIQGYGSYDTDVTTTESKDHIEKIIKKNEKLRTRYPTFISTLSYAKTRTIDSRVILAEEKGSPTNQIYINNAANYTATDTTLLVDDNAGNSVIKFTPPGTLLLNTRTMEVMLVTSTSGEAVVVTRAVSDSTLGGVAAAAINNDDVLLILNKATGEGGDVIESVYEQPTLVKGYVGEYEESVKLTTDELRRALKVEGANLYKEKKADALARILEQIDLSFFLAQPGLPTLNSNKIRMNQGLYAALNKEGGTYIKDAAGALTKTNFNAYMESFDGGSATKIVYSGISGISTVVGLLDSAIRLTSRDTKWGIVVTSWITPGGVTANLMHDPNLDRTPFADWLWVVSADDVERYTLQGGGKIKTGKLHYIPEAMPQDVKKNVGLWHCDLGWQFLGVDEGAHGLIKDVA